MGKHLDLDDVVSGNPKAAAQLDELRDLLNEARSREERAVARSERAEQRVADLEKERGKLLEAVEGSLQAAILGGPSEGLKIIRDAYAQYNSPDLQEGNG